MESKWYTIVIRDILGETTKYRVAKEPYIMQETDTLVIEMDENRKVFYRLDHVISFNINANEGEFIPFTHENEEQKGTVSYPDLVYATEYMGDME